MTPKDLPTKKIAGKSLMVSRDAEGIGQAKVICLASGEFLSRRRLSARQVRQQQGIE
jgi:hypothetical protein